MHDAISILGSTGSIGRQTLEVAELLKLRVCALSGDTNISLLEDQVRKYHPSIAAVYDADAARDFKTRVSDLDTRVVSGPGGLIEAATVDGASTVVIAVVGMVGLLPTLAAIDTGRRVALANKETLVCAGEIVMKRAASCSADIIPVDSEHSALYQCLKGEPLKNMRKLILTASGGPFRGWKREDLSGVTPEMALRHPVWNMGKKTTVDSATLMNKGLEVIEAIRFFSIAPEQVSVVVHPEGIVHSMAEMNDNSVIAHLSAADMRLPIQYALTAPERMPSLAAPLDFTVLTPLTFEKPDMEAFPCLALAMETVKRPGTACAVLNAANEAAVDLFLQGRLSFSKIHDAIRLALEQTPNIESPSPDDIIKISQTAKQLVVCVT